MMTQTYNSYEWYKMDDWLAYSRRLKVKTYKHQLKNTYLIEFKR